jgi:non-specific serine/threonine protein kinase
MGEEVASFAVLGVDIDALGSAVARHWGLDDSVVHMIRRVPWAAPVHSPDGDDDLLRLTASCANEVVDANSVPPHHRHAWLQRVTQRYSRVLGVTLRDLQLSAQGISPHEDKPEPPGGAATTSALAGAARPSGVAAVRAGSAT